MYKLMIKQYYNDFQNISTNEYSGIEHETIKAANIELLEAKAHEADNENLFALYVEEAEKC